MERANAERSVPFPPPQATTVETPPVPATDRYLRMVRDETLLATYQISLAGAVSNGDSSLGVHGLRIRSEVGDPELTHSQQILVSSQLTHGLRI